MKLSVVIIARNEEEMIEDCLKSVAWADEVVVVDTGSTDKTIEAAKKHKVRVVKMPWKGYRFSEWRNRGLKEARGDWVFYVDADERVTPELRNEILRAIAATPRRSPASSAGHHPRSRFIAFEIPRRNFYLGREMRYGGAWPDYVRRLFLKKRLKGWRGKLHEQPVVEGEWGRLKSPLIHLTHRDLSSMVEKTREWSKIEAELLYQVGHPPVTWWRILRIMLAEFWQRAIKLQGWRDGTVGWIEIIFQMFSRFITYARLWEMQREKLKIN